MKFKDLCAARMTQGRIDHGDWQKNFRGKPLELFDMLLEELADAYNYAGMMLTFNELKYCHRPLRQFKKTIAIMGGGLVMVRAFAANHSEKPKGSK